VKANETLNDLGWIDLTPFESCLKRLQCIHTLTLKRLEKSVIMHSPIMVLELEPRLGFCCRASPQLEL
jgi:hypothetical protein